MIKDVNIRSSIQNESPHVSVTTRHRMVFRILPALSSINPAVTQSFANYRNMKNVLKLSEADLKYGQKSSWHDQYRNSAWIFVGGLPYDLSEGDVVCVFSQYGEIVNINLVRDKVTGKQKGFCFLCYEDQRSTVLAVDNLNGIKVN